MTRYRHAADSGERAAYQYETMTPDDGAVLCPSCQGDTRPEDIEESDETGKSMCQECLDETDGQNCSVCRERDKDGIYVNDKWKCRECVENEDE